MKKKIGLLALVLAVIIALLGWRNAANADEGSEEPCVPSDAWTETIPGTPGQHYSWTGEQRPVSDPPAEVPPSENWQANTEQEPHDNGQGNPATWVNESLHYTDNASGRASWFYYTQPTPDTYIEHPAVDCPPDDVVVTPSYSATLFCPPRGEEIRVEGELVGVGSGETDTYTYDISKNGRFVNFTFEAKDGFVFEGGETTFSDSIMLPILRCPVTPEDPEDPENPENPVEPEEPEEPNTPKDPQDPPKQGIGTPTSKSAPVPTSVDAGL